MSLPPSFFDHLEDRLNLAVYDINESHRMGLRELRDALNGRKATVNYSGEGRMYANLPKVSFEVHPDDTAVDIKLRIESREMNITGAANLAGTIKSRIDAAKSKIAKVSENTDNALTKLNAAADHGDKIAKQIETEADDLLSQIGQLSNMPPE